MVSFYSDGRRKKNPQAFLKQACGRWHTAQEGVLCTSFRAEVAGGGGGSALPRQALGLGGGLKATPCVKEARRDPCGI